MYIKHDLLLQIMEVYYKPSAIPNCGLNEIKYRHNIQKMSLRNV